MGIVKYLVVVPSFGMTGSLKMSHYLYSTHLSSVSMHVNDLAHDSSIDRVDVNL